MPLNCQPRAKAAMGVQKSLNGIASVLMTGSEDLGSSSPMIQRYREIVSGSNSRKDRLWKAGHNYMKPVGRLGWFG